uniref:HTH myb-type domain-containing protein n=1 Tax=Solanum lycopersicum TaxID=4081 RepID=K4DDL4_SOLLC
MKDNLNILTSNFVHTIYSLEEHGAKNWSFISQLIPSRTAKSCRERWCNHLNPQLDHRSFTLEEEDIIFKAHAKFGNQWTMIESLLYPWLSLDPHIAPFSEIFPFSSVSPVFPGLSTTMSISLIGFQSSQNLNPINPIEQEDEVTLVLASEPNPSNFMPQTSITQSGNSCLTNMEKQLLSPIILKVL